jgi:hypothetical protein
MSRVGIPSRLFAVLLACSVASNLAGDVGRRAIADETEILTQKQQLQEKARRLAGELVAVVLDVQLRQLRENGLEQLPIYGEIESMSRNIDGLVNEEMQQVVESLVRAQSGSREERLRHFEAARQTTREVVVTLMAERQKLYRRLRIARLAAQVREAIDLQAGVRQTTESLSGKTAEQRERATLAAIQDQQDARALYLQLVVVLEDVTTWSGSIGAAASDGLRLLQAARVATHLTDATDALRKADYPPAIESQGEVLRGLKALLDLVEAGRGLISSDREEALKMVREMIERQQTLREQAADDRLSDQQRNELVDQQTQLQRDLAKMDAALQPFAGAEPLLDQAKTAAAEAATQLFDGDTRQAQAEQGQVIGSLSAIEDQLQRGLAQDLSDKSAQQLMDEVAQLEALETKLDAISEKQQGVVEQAAEKPAEVRETQEQVAQQLDEAGEPELLPPTIQSRLEDAQQHAEQSEQELRDASPEQAEARREAAQQTAKAIDQARAEVKAALADTRRRQLAVEVGELARAAEALERAAAAQRDVARESSQAAKEEKGLSESRAEQLSAEQTKVGQVADDIARGVQRAAPDAAKKLDEARSPIEAARDQLQQAAQASDAKANKQAAEKAAEAGAQAAAKLEQAASELRRRQGETARELAKVADEQLQQVAAAREAVEQATPTLPDAGDPLQKTQQALQQVRAAQTAQDKAAGRTAAAEARQRAEQVEALQGEQQRAEQAAQRVRNGQSRSPLEATLQQQKVSEAAADLAAAADDPAATELKKAAEAAREAAEADFDGRRQQADAARQEARAALDRAAEAARQMAQQASQLPPGEPDAEAQRQVQQLAEKGKQLAEAVAPQAADALDEATQQSATASKALQAGLPEATQTSQAETAKALARAEMDLQQRQQALTGEASQELAKQADQTQQLARQAAAIDAGAAAALNQATQTAQQAATEAGRQAAQPAKPSSASPASPVPAARQEVQRRLEQAVASLAARQQQIQRDRDIAGAIADLAGRQQMAREEIAQQAKTLEKMAARLAGHPASEHPGGEHPGGEHPASEHPGGEHPAGGTPAMHPTAEELAAATGLREATQEFANAQRATGEGAAAISGQKQVANPDIRQGLEKASKLAQGHPLPGSLEGEPLAQLTPPAEGAAPASGEPASGQPAAGEAAGSEPAAGGQPMPPQPMSPSSAATGDGAPPPGAAGSDASQPGTPGEGANAAGSPATGQNQALGTNLVPSAPEATASQIAGAQAMQQAAQALAAAPGGPPSGEGEAGQPGAAQQPGQPSPQPGGEAQPDGSSSLASKGGSAKGSESGQNQPSPDAPLQLDMPPSGDSRTPDGDTDSDAVARQFADAPWFARLPPSLREAIQSRSRRRPPRGYEERLRRYFESIE